MTVSLANPLTLAGLELNAAVAAGVLPPALWDGARTHPNATPIHDLGGELLYLRIPVTTKSRGRGYADIATHRALGGPLLAAALGVNWSADSLKKDGIAAARRQKTSLRYTRTRFVTYSYPKLALQFLDRDTEVLLLELGTWRPVPESARELRELLKPSNFERWSLLDELSPSHKRSATTAVNQRLRTWEKALSRTSVKGFRPALISASQFEKYFLRKLTLFDSWELHYSKRRTDHFTCYELRGQETSVWCVAASTQMLLDFYRYEYLQTRIATELGLGTKSNPSGLPYSRVGDVVTAVEALSSNCLNCTMVTNPTWTTFRSEIIQNRPLISFIPGHSRTVAGYSRSFLSLLTGGLIGFRGLLVYDPWPPNAGVVTRWENFDTQTYQFAYTSAVTLA